MEKLITIKESEYDDLIKQSAWLSCLEAVGVDNWEGHDIAIDMFREQYPEED